MNNSSVLASNQYPSHPKLDKTRGDKWLLTPDNDQESVKLNQFEQEK